jgi:hypothetical protein
MYVEIESNDLNNHVGTGHHTRDITATIAGYCMYRLRAWPAPIMVMAHQ